MALALLHDLEVAGEKLEGLLLLLVEVVGVLLARQLDHQLLGIVAVDAGDDHRAVFAEAPQSVVVGNLDRGVLVDVDAGLVEHAAHLQHDLVDELLVAGFFPGDACRQAPRRRRSRGRRPCPAGTGRRSSARPEHGIAKKTSCPADRLALGDRPPAR